MVYYSLSVMPIVTATIYEMQVIFYGKSCFVSSFRISVGETDNRDPRIGHVATYIKYSKKFSFTGSFQTYDTFGS